MYEVEYKVEITEEEQKKLIELFLSKGFEMKSPKTQNNIYVEATESPLGGFDIKRYRDEGDTIFYTEKIWEDNNGDMLRKEIEREATTEELAKQLSLYPDALKIKKDRQSFVGTYNGKDIHVDMDTVKFGHSPSMRYFFEAEVLTDDKDKVRDLRNSMLDFIKQCLGKSEIKEAEGMFTMAFKKL